jgi:hypothetical protein
LPRSQRRRYRALCGKQIIDQFLYKNQLTFPNLLSPDSDCFRS